MKVTLITTAPAHSCGMFRRWQWSCMPQLMAPQMAPQMAAPMAGKCLPFGKRWDKTCRPWCRHVLRSRAFQWRRSTESSQHEMTWNRNRHVSTRPWTPPSGMGIGSVSCSKKWTAGNAKETETSKDGRVCATFGHEERRRCKAAESVPSLVAAFQVSPEGLSGDLCPELWHHQALSRGPLRSVYIDSRQQ